MDIRVLLPIIKSLARRFSSQDREDFEQNLMEKVVKLLPRMQGMTVEEMIKFTRRSLMNQIISWHREKKLNEVYLEDLLAEGMNEISEAISVAPEQESLVASEQLISEMGKWARRKKPVYCKFIQELARSATMEWGAVQPYVIARECGIDGHVVIKIISGLRSYLSGMGY